MKIVGILLMIVIAAALAVRQHYATPPTVRPAILEDGKTSPTGSPAAQTVYGRALEKARGVADEARAQQAEAAHPVEQ